MELRKINHKILTYLGLLIKDDTTLQVKEFFNLVIDQMTKKEFSHSELYFVEASNAIIEYGDNNIFFQEISA